ncbi:hypothetical protein Emtol_4065 [Emticicia oligotrophica DSM 17448]|uniref:DUF4251 domain-containing protein n=1 Tax=Emticicia oligotrophica (strain DSM 17448 / CIP 109782 / MTCC 6937 / GPTSA100-15) TaxID=929562 RepID=A0ABM5N769_EMTOG|nr:hypothetical protein [Emticicia oligotrophica]AFK05190.1 hypothetical protein Emtol_4065 [Emticicia oligotrophica DSM 17448]
MKSLRLLFIAVCFFCFVNTNAKAQLKEFGLLKSAEDSGYPFASLTIEFPERNFSENFTINLEEVKNVNMGTLQKWVGKYVSFTYNSDLTNALMEMQLNGKSVINDEPIELGPNSLKLVGILRGAAKVTAGDLPSVISVTTANNEKYSFEFFITPQMVKANNKKVVVYFEEIVSNTILQIKLSK